jgi:hypothetical protein
MVTSGAKSVLATPRGSHTSGVSHIALLGPVYRKDGIKLSAQWRQHCYPDEIASGRKGGAPGASAQLTNSSVSSVLFIANL